MTLYSSQPENNLTYFFRPNVETLSQNGKELYNYIKDNDFRLPALNREIMEKRFKEPSLEEIKYLQNKYPKFQMTIEATELDFMHENVQKISTILHLDDPKNLIKEIESITDKKNMVLKLMLSSIVAGRKLLKKRLAIVIWLHLTKHYGDKKLEKYSFSFTDFFLEGSKKPSQKDSFLYKMYQFLQSETFEVPLLNREKWKKWPMKMPTKDEMDTIRQKFPDMHEGVLSERKEEKMLRRYDKLIQSLGFEPTIQGRNEVLNKLLTRKKRRFLRIKLLVAIYLSGSKMLKKRLAIDCWRRFIRLSEKWNGSLEQVERKEILNLVQKQNGKKTDFVKIRQQLGYQPSQMKTVRLQLKSTLEKYAKEKTCRGVFSSEEVNSLVYVVFKQLQISNILDYKRKVTPISWNKVCEEFDRPPSALSRKWFKIACRLLFFEETGSQSYQIYQWHNQICQLVLANTTILDIKDVCINNLAKEVPYISFEEIHGFLTQVNKSAIKNAKDFRSMISQTQDRTMRRKGTKSVQDDYTNLVEFYSAIRNLPFYNISLEDNEDNLIGHQVP